MAILLMTWMQTRTPQEMLGRIMALLMFRTYLAGDLRDIEQMEPDHVICHTENIRLAADDMDGIPPGLESLQSEPDNRAGRRVRREQENPPHPSARLHRLRTGRANIGRFAGIGREALFRLVIHLPDHAFGVTGQIFGDGG